MKNIFQINDYKDPIKYEAFIDYAFMKCTSFMLVYVNYNGKGYSTEKKQYKNALNKFVIKSRNNPKWPGTPYTYSNNTKYNIVFYRTDSEVREIIKKDRCLFDWSAPLMPEDLAFFIGDTCWFYSVGHESISFVIHPDYDDYLFFKKYGMIENEFDYFDADYYGSFDEPGLEYKRLKY